VTQAKEAPIYGNWTVLGPDGQLMFRTNQKRADWYLSRALAVQVEPSVIKLTFTPNGPGNVGHAALIEDKKNQCAVCGTLHNLNRHHVVPYQYRKHFPLEHKARTSYDILPLCLEHHEEYEIEAQEFSKTLSKEYGVPFNTYMPMTLTEVEQSRHLKLMSALLNTDHQLPANRRESIEAQIAEYTMRSGKTKAELEDIIKLKPSNRLIGKLHGELIVEAVLKDELQPFIQRWRQHFLDTMHPQFMSENWTVDFVHSRHKFTESIL
jgi:hypothetical protein